MAATIPVGMISAHMVSVKLAIDVWKKYPAWCRIYAILPFIIQRNIFSPLPPKPCWMSIEDECLVKKLRSVDTTYFTLPLLVVM